MAGDDQTDIQTYYLTSSMLTFFKVVMTLKTKLQTHNVPDILRIALSLSDTIVLIIIVLCALRNRCFHVIYQCIFVVLIAIFPM